MTMGFRELPVVKPELKALGEALGEDGIREIIRRFYQKMSGDLLVGFFFEGQDLDAIADKQTEFILRAMGLRSTYSGKAPADAHKALPPILSGHFDRRLVLLDQTLTEAGLSEAQRRAWIGLENAFRDGIIGPGIKS